MLPAFAELLEHGGHARAARRVLAFAAGEPTISIADRDELRAEWERRTAGAGPGDAPWPGIALDELLRRIDHESAAAPAGASKHASKVLREIAHSSSLQSTSSLPNNPTRMAHGGRG